MPLVETWVFAAPLSDGRWVVTCTSCGRRDLCLTEQGATVLVDEHLCQPDLAGVPG